MTEGSVLIQYPINVSKEDASCISQFCFTKMTSFGPFFGPSSDLYTRTHKRNSTNYLM